MTGDRNVDVLMAALRSPAHPAELANETTVVDAMAEVLTAAPARQAPRPRRGAAIAAVTVASLGIGGLVAAGPGILLPAGDTPATTTAPNTTERTSAPPTGRDTSSDRSLNADPDDLGNPATQPGATPGGPATAAADGDASETCPDGNHGAAVAEAAHSSLADGAGRADVVVPAAQSACGTGKRSSGDASGDGGSVTTPHGPPSTTPGKGQPPADPGNQGQPPADPGSQGHEGGGGDQSGDQGRQGGGQGGQGGERGGGAGNGGDKPKP